MYACFGLIHLPYTESMRSETPRQLSQDRVRLHVNWVNAEWDSISTESTQRAPTFTKISRQLSQHRVRLHIKWVNAKGTNIHEDFNSVLIQLTWSLTPRWHSRHGVSLGTDSVDREWDSASIESPPNVKNLNKSANSRTKSKTLKSFIIWPIYVWSVQKNEQN
jgi:hypothetical protein